MMKNKNVHLFQINFEENLHQDHDHEFEHDHKEDRELLHHNVIHLYQDLCSTKDNSKLNKQI